MKKFLFVVLAIMALPSVASAINVGTTPTGPIDFSTQPAALDWATSSLSVTSGTDTNNAASIDNEAELDAGVNTRTAASIATQLPIDAANPPTNQAGTFRWNQPAQLIESNSTGNSANLLKASFLNTGTNYITDFTVSYDFGRSGTGTEEVNGLRAYWGTGAAGAWTPIGTFGTAGPVTFNVNGLGTNFGADPFYLVWADDNAVIGGLAAENYYTIDNFTVTPTGFGGLLDPPTPVVPTHTLSSPWVNSMTPGTSTVPLTTDEATAGVNVVSLATGDAIELNQTPNALTRLNQETPYFSIPDANGVAISIDFKLTDTSSGLEAADIVHLRAEYSSDGLLFNTVDILNTNDTASDQYIVPTSDDPFFHFAGVIPAGATMGRVLLTLQNDSASEHIFVDNLVIAPIPIPEPGSVVLVGLGMIGMVGYGIRRRRSA